MLQQDSHSQQDDHSRRSLVAAATGAIGAYALWAIGRPTPALAEGETVVVGGEYNTATSSTKITSTADIKVFEARNGSSGATGVGLAAHSNNGTALLVSSSNLTPAVRADTTIYGFHNGSQLGHTPVVARFEVHEQSASFATAIALQVIGKTQFSKSGVATILAGQNKVVVPVTQITAKSFALATLQQARAGVYVIAAGCQVAASTITIRLNVAPSQDTRVGYFVLEQPA
jgi:hypothetical protein